MKRERPPQPPLHVREIVAFRQFCEGADGPSVEDYDRLVSNRASLSRRIAWLLSAIFGDRPVALDHDTALILRKYNATVSDVAARYTPHAHDPNHLVYREKADHQRKTTGRTIGAECTVTTKGSDIWLKSKFNRLEGRTKQRPTRKIRSRGFQKRAD